MALFLRNLFSHFVSHGPSFPLPLVELLRDGFFSVCFLKLVQKLLDFPRFILIAADAIFEIFLHFFMEHLLFGGIPGFAQNEVGVLGELVIVVGVSGVVRKGGGLFVVGIVMLEGLFVVVAAQEAHFAGPFSFDLLEQASFHDKIFDLLRAEIHLYQEIEEFISDAQTEQKLPHQWEGLLLNDVFSQLLYQTFIHGFNDLGIVGKNGGLLLLLLERLVLVENVDGILLRWILDIVEDATSEGLVLVSIVIIAAKEGLLREGAGICLIFVGKGAERTIALTGLEEVGIGLVLTEKSFALILVLKDITSLARSELSKWSIGSSSSKGYTTALYIPIGPHIVGTSSKNSICTRQIGI